MTSPFDRGTARGVDAQDALTTGLRMRYRPAARIHGALIFVAPWIDLLLILGMFVLFNGTMVVQPGAVVRLPVAPFRDGVQGGMVAVVLAIDPTPGQGGGELVFFDDERFRVGGDDDVDRLRHALAAEARRQPWAPLVIQADGDVKQSTVMLLVRLASEAGIADACLATRPE
jgi:biopolymer transport protein ExbD